MVKLSNDGTRDDVTLINGATSPTSELYPVQRTKTIFVSVSGTATSASLSFSSVYADGQTKPTTGISNENFALLSTATIGTGARFSVGGTDKFKVTLDSVSGGNVSVLIREVD